MVTADSSKFLPLAVSRRLENLLGQPWPWLAGLQDLLMQEQSSEAEAVSHACSQEAVLPEHWSRDPDSSRLVILGPEEGAHQESSGTHFWVLRQGPARLC